MRLLSLDEQDYFRLTDFPNDDDIPPYAILSHTWGRDNAEVTYDDIDQRTGKEKLGYGKLIFCGEQAQKDGLDYFWVDTCCINKSDTSELSKAITSMYRWYRRAQVCYVYLADVSARKRNHQGELLIRDSKWFTRGWTLQELLAPSTVRFYSQEGELLGDKSSLKRLIEEVTEIPSLALEGTNFYDFPIKERLRWASKRQTTEMEDKVYCLQGIFDVYMLPNYGECKNAFPRLIEEILKKHNVDLQGYTNDFFNSTMTRTDLNGDNANSVYENVTTWSCPTQKKTDLKKTEEGEAARQIPMAERRKALLDSLHFAQMDSRRDDIKLAHRATCAWFLDNQTYVRWTNPEEYDSHHGFLWLKGNPGTGKSTLINYVCNSAEENKAEKEIVVSFFFNARGNELEQSTTGMYRAILLQIFNKCPDLQRLLATFPQDPAHVWTVKSLHKLLSLLIRELGGRRLKCFIDALDECDEGQIQEMLYNLDELAKHSLLPKHKLYICFASRHYPTINIEGGLEITLENESGHAQDIKAYILCHLKVFKSGTKSDARVNDIRKTIQEKANGIFLWIVLVIDILNKEYKRGAIFAVKTRLEEIPNGLSSLFRDIVKRDSDHMTEFLLCLQWILLARRPLRPDELYFAMLVSLNADPDNWRKRDTILLEDITAFVRSSSKGLAEITLSSEPTVQFIHESVKDYLNGHGVIEELWPDHVSQSTTRGHDDLKRVCQMYLNVDLSDYVTFDRPLPAPESDSAIELRRILSINFPFLEYAGYYMTYHAEEAAKTLDQREFLEQIPLARWIDILNVLESCNGNHRTPSANLSYLLAELGRSRLLQTWINKYPDEVGETNHETYKCALLVAFANGHRNVIETIANHANSAAKVDNIVANFNFGDLDFAPEELTPFYTAIERDIVELARLILSSTYNNAYPTCYTQRGAERDIEQGFERDVEHSFERHIEQGFEGAVRLMMALNASEAREKRNECDQNLMEPSEPLVLDDQISPDDQLLKKSLFFAIKSNNVSIVEFLLENGVDANSIDEHGLTTLAMANASPHNDNGVEYIVEALLDYGADIEAVDLNGNTPLLDAIENRKVDIVHLLLERGANIEAMNSKQETPLLRALSIGDGHFRIFSLLLQYDANTEAKGSDGRTPLLRAITGSNTPVIHLLHYNPNIEARGPDGRTALLHALTLHDFEKAGLLADHELKTKLTNGSAGWNMASKKLLAAGDPAISTAIGSASIEMRLKTALHHAATQSDLLSIKQLIDRGANIEARDEDDKTPLLCAISEGQASSVFLLLHFGAAVEARDKIGNTALMTWVLNYTEPEPYCSISKPKDIPLSWLMDKGADVNAKRADGESVLSLTAANGHYGLLITFCRGYRAKVTDELLQKAMEGRFPMSIVDQLFESPFHAGFRAERAEMRTRWRDVRSSWVGRTLSWVFSFT